MFNSDPAFTSAVVWQEKKMEMKDFNFSRFLLTVRKHFNLFLSIHFHKCEKQSEIFYFWVVFGPFEVFVVRHLADMQLCSDNLNKGG